MLRNRKVIAGLVVGLSAIGLAATADATSPANSEVVMTGAYRCPGNFVGFQHSITFNTSDGANMPIETQFGNLDTGDCTPRGKNASDVAKKLGCTVGPTTPFQQGGGFGAAFGFVCKGERSYILNAIQQLSTEILRLTGP